MIVNPLHEYIAQSGLPTQREVIQIFTKDFISFVHHQTAVFADIFDGLNAGTDAINQFIWNIIRFDSEIGRYWHVGIHQTFFPWNTHL